MTSLRMLDQRILDQSLTGGVALSLPMRPRYNTPMMTKFLNSSRKTGVAASYLGTVGKGSVHYNEYWDPDLQSYMYLHDFINTRREWRDEFVKIALDNGTPSQQMDQDRLDNELRQILDLAPEREERFMEVMDQDDADGAVNYWLGILQVSPARNPATYLMLRVGRRIGEHVVMCLKGHFRSPRPSQLSPAMVPMIDPPATPSFPAGHAVQAYLMSYLLAYSLRNIPQQHLSDVDTAEGPLFDLAYRVSQNRVIAGVHFPTDIEAGKAVGIATFRALKKVPSIWDDSEGLRAKVRAEFPQYA
jgi:PAP2 superfamily